MSELDWQFELPPELRSDQYDYPPVLFRDWKQVEGHEKIMRFDGSDEIPMNIVTNSERVVLMAKYAVAKSLRLTCAEDRLIRIVRNEEGSSSSFMQGVRKVRHSEVMGALERGDIELKADELGVYEVIWPLDPEKMRAAQESEEELADAIAA